MLTRISQMVIKAPPADPIIVSSTDLENYRKILNLYGKGRRIRSASGNNKPHMWFSRPMDHGSLPSRMKHGFKELAAAV
jgi:hypothetical protein